MKWVLHDVELYIQRTSVEHRPWRTSIQHPGCSKRTSYSSYYCSAQSRIRNSSSNPVPNSHLSPQKTTDSAPYHNLELSQALPKAKRREAPATTCLTISNCLYRHLKPELLLQDIDRWWPVITRRRSVYCGSSPWKNNSTDNALLLLWVGQCFR